MTQLIYVNNNGFCNVYDISTYEQLQETFGNIIHSVGGEPTKILGMKKLSELTSILEYDHNIFITMNKLCKGRHGYITNVE